MYRTPRRFAPVVNRDLGVVTFSSRFLLRGDCGRHRGTRFYICTLPGVTEIKGTKEPCQYDEQYSKIQNAYSAQIACIITFVIHWLHHKLSIMSLQQGRASLPMVICRRYWPVRPCLLHPRKQTLAVAVFSPYPLTTTGQACGSSHHGSDNRRQCRAAPSSGCHCRAENPETPPARSRRSNWRRR